MRKAYVELDARTIIGNTPIVRLPDVGHGNVIWAKLEYKNPTGSHYDRVYRPLIQHLEDAGKIKSGITTLVETTSGNAGISFGFFARELGYSAIVFVPSGLPQRRTDLIRRTGATVIEAPEDDWDAYISAAALSMGRFLRYHRQRSDGVPLYWSTNHSRSDVAWQSLASAAKEILAAVGSPDIFIGAAGNGSTLRGIAGTLKVASPKMRVIAFEPVEAPNAYELKYGHEPDAPLTRMRRHRLLGTGGWGIELPHLTHAIANVVDEVCLIKEAEWIPAQQELHTLGYSVGPTSAAAYCLAKQHCEHVTNQSVCIIFYDEANRY